MQAVTREGPQKRLCVVEECDRAPAGPTEVYCAGHLKWFETHNGSPLNQVIVEPDDPELLEREAKRAREAEEAEYAERRRVKTWRTLENGTRVPEEYWTDDELARMTDEAEELASHMGDRFAMDMNTANEVIGEIYDPDGRIRAARAAMPDPVKEATRIFKRALRGKLGEVAKEHAWSTVRILDDMQ